MPRPVCVKCLREMEYLRPVVVQFNALSVNGPYQQWYADEAECPVCKQRTVTRYADRLSWAHQHGPETRNPKPDYIVQERSPLTRPLGATP